MKYTHLYPDDAPKKLEYDKILEIIDGYCISELGKRFIPKIRVSSDANFIKMTLEQVKEMKNILEQEAAFPASNFLPLDDMLGYLSIPNAVLNEEQFLQLLLFLLTVQDIFEFLKQRAGRFIRLEELLKGQAFEKNLLHEIASVISEEGEVRPGVSPTLDKIRKEIKSKEKELDNTFNKLLQSANNSGWLEAGAESLRNGRRVLALLSENKRRIKGVIHDESATGKTVYIEPEATLELTNELFELHQAERREVYRILKELTAKIQPFVTELYFYQQLAGLFDFIRAKAKLAMELNANIPELLPAPEIHIMKAFHPLLYLHNKKNNKYTVPLGLHLDSKNRILLVSGPNAGGKSVALKTVGLLQMMLQSGMLIPVWPDSKFGIFDKIFVELGDEQSIENELSTYSSRLTHTKFFLEKTDRNTLFLIDEFGTGTDPKFGGALAEAILEALNKKKGFGVINTHYSNLKVFAGNTPGIINGAMMFNTETLASLYELRIGRPGSSHTFEIAKKIGLPQGVIDNAAKKMDKEYHNMDSMLATLETDKHLTHLSKGRLEKQEQELQSLIDTYTSLKQDLESNKKKILLEAKQKSITDIEKTKQRFDELLKELRLEEKERAREEKIREELLSEKKQLHTELKELKAVVSKKEAKPVEQGSFVKLHGGAVTGIVEELRNERALVSFGNLRSLVSLEELEVVEKAPEKLKQSIADTQKLTDNFQQTLDVRGMRTEDALREVENQLDRAMLIGIYSIRILHGKGNGILRKFIRELLRKYSFVKDFHNEADEFGGNGITIVELE